VAWQSRYGLCLREHVPQRPGLTPARQHVCEVFGSKSQMWSARLSDEQQERWILACAQVMSHPRLATKGPLTGQQLWTAISTVRDLVGLPETLEVPLRPVFALSNVGRLIMETTETGVRMWFAVSGDLNEDVMVRRWPDPGPHSSIPRLCLTGPANSPHPPPSSGNPCPPLAKLLQ